MILFKQIRWRNFLSTGNTFTEVDFTEAQTNLIVGTNGAGKSTVLDALTFVLFNKPFRKINKPQLINSVNEKDCTVEIEFSTGSIEWKVIRGIKPNVFEIYKNGEHSLKSSFWVVHHSFLSCNSQQQVVVRSLKICWTSRSFLT